MIRELTPNVSHWSDLNQYFFYWQGDELLMKATNDEEAYKEGVQLEAELSTEEI